jgi:hypothetical protein
VRTKTTTDTQAAVPTEWADVAQQWFKAYRAGFDTLLAVANASLAGTERMRMAQLEADVETQTQNRNALLAVADCRDVNGLLALQSRLATAYMEGAMRYWATLAQLTQQTNAEIAKVLGARYDDWAKAMQGALPAGTAAAPMPQPLATAFEAARASQEAMMKSLASLAALPAQETKRAA